MHGARYILTDLKTLETYTTRSLCDQETDAVVKGLATVVKFDNDGWVSVVKEIIDGRICWVFAEQKDTIDKQ